MVFNFDVYMKNVQPSDIGLKEEKFFENPTLDRIAAVAKNVFDWIANTFFPFLLPSFEVVLLKRGHLDEFRAHDFLDQMGISRFRRSIIVVDGVQPDENLKNKRLLMIRVDDGTAPELVSVEPEQLNKLNDKGFNRKILYYISHSSSLLNFTEELVRRGEIYAKPDGEFHPYSSYFNLVARKWTKEIS
jgi:hypothetical protein